MATGNYRGRHYTEWIDEVKALNRARRLDEAAELLDGLMAATLAEARARGSVPAPWYFEQAAIVARKVDDAERERAVLVAYLDATDEPSPTIAERLRKLDAKAATAGQPSGACPACGSVLDPVPRRSGPCPHCGETLTVRTINGMRRLLGPADVAEADAAAARNAVLVHANRIGVTDEAFDARAAELGPARSLGDVFWSLANERITTLGAAGDWISLRDTYKEMAAFVHGEGRDPIPLDRESVRAGLRAELAWARDLDATLQVTGCDCAPCSAPPRRHRIGDLDVDGDLPLPHEGCAKGRCTCWLWAAPSARDGQYTVEIDVAGLLVDRHGPGGNDGERNGSLRAAIRRLWR